MYLLLDRRDLLLGVHSEYCHILVSAGTPQRGSLAHGIRQYGGSLADGEVARTVPECIIDLLEMIQIGHHRHKKSVLVGIDEAGCNTCHTEPVVQPRQIVVPCQSLQLCPVPLLCHRHLEMSEA